MAMLTQQVDRAAQSVGYAGAGLFTGLTLADIDLLIRIGVGTLTIISICVHLYFKFKNEKRKK